jgi:hypothetical protein
MLNRNFANVVVGALSSTQSTGVGDNQCPLTNTSGTSYTSESSSLGPAGKILYSISNIGTSFISVSNNYKSSFSIGSGETAESINDYALANPISETDFSIQTGSSTKISSNSQRLLTQVWQYNGSSEITIKEVGLFVRVWRSSSEAEITMFDRTVLESPITVNNGDTFTIALTIGGKATVTVNS